jgi:hypothetical protein
MNRKNLIRVQSLYQSANDSRVHVAAGAQAYEFAHLFLLLLFSNKHLIYLLHKNTNSDEIEQYPVTPVFTMS